MAERFKLKEIEIDDYIVECADAKIVITENDRIIGNERVVKILNEYESTRKRKNREIAKFRKREELYQRVISGMMAFLELQINDVLWYEWND